VTDAARAIVAQVRRIPFIRVLRRRDFALLWAAMGLSRLGDFVTQVGLLVLVYRLTESSLALGSLVTLQLIPGILLAPLAGALVDRWDRRRVMIIADILRGLCVLALVVYPAVATIYFVGLTVSFVSLFFGPARRALIPQLVDDSELMAANSLGSSTVSLARVLGPALGGALVALCDVTVAFGFDAATFFVSAVLIGAMGRRSPGAANAGPAAGLGRAIGRGMRFLLSEPSLLTLLGLNVCVLLGIGACNVLLLVIIKDVLGASDAALGAMMSVEGVGGIVGMVLIGNLLAGVNPSRLVAGAVAFIGAGLIGVSVLPYLGGVIALVGGLGIAVVVFNVGAETVFQRRVPDRMRGLAFSVINSAAMATTLASAAGAGVAAEFVRPTVVLGTLGGLVLGGGLFGWLLLGRAGRSQPEEVSAEAG